MSIRGGERGQSVQIGAVILFAGLVLLLATYQAVAVPAQNRGVEFDHSQQVRGDLLDLRNAVASTLGDATRQSVSVRLGTTYPSRVLAVNPPPATGHLRTVGTADGNVAVGIANAEALDGETDDFWNGTERTYGTGAIAYRPDYNEYGQPPSTVYESSVLYDAFAAEGTTVARSGQALVDGDRITLVALNGSLQRSASGAASVDVRPVSASSTTVTVRNAEPDANVTLRVPTRLSEDRWEELLSDEFVGEGGNITADGVRTTPLPGVEGYELLEIEFVPGTYELQLAKAGVGTGVTGTDAAYVVDVEGDDTVVSEGGTARLVVEVRDRFNNPVVGTPVDAAANGTGMLQTTSDRTDGAGRVVLVYEAPEDVDGDPRAARVNVTIEAGTAPGSDAFDASTAGNVSLNVTVRNTDGSGLGGGGDSDAAFAVDWADPRDDNGGAEISCSMPDACAWDVANSSDRTLTVRGVTSPAVQRTELQFGVDDSEVGSLSRYAGATDDDGTATTTLTPESEGSVTLFVAGGGTSRELEIAIEGLPPGERDPGHPFEDVNGDGLYQEGSDVALSASDVEGSYEAAATNGLVVPESTRALSADSVDWSADGVRLATDLSVSQEASIDARGSDLTVDEATVSADSSISLTGGDTDLDGATLTTADGWGSITVDASGSLTGEGLTVESSAHASLTGGSVGLDGATIDSSLDGGGWAGVDVTATDGPVSLIDADIESPGTTTVEGTSVDLTDASVNTHSNRGYGDIQLRSTDGTVVVEQATLSASGSLSADAADVNGDDGDLFVADTELYENGDPGSMYNENGADVVGRPAVGWIRPR